MKSTKSMHGKTCLITGASSGLGLESAKVLAGMGADIILVCRSREKGEAVLRDLVVQSGNDRHHLLIADMGSQAQIRTLAGEINNRFSRLDILMNNAGLLLGERTVTEDGYETTFAVNHLGYFLLTLLLEDLLKASSPSRIINVSSMVHAWGNMHFHDLGLEKEYAPMKAYSQSKLANVMFTYSMARRLEGSGVTVNALHPGIVNTRFGHGGTFFYKLFKAIARPFMFIPVERGAETQIHLASAPELENVSGKYFVKKKAVESSPLSNNKEAQEKLWKISEQMTARA